MLDASNASSPAAADSARAGLGVVHRRRLREVYRSAGWPCQDGIEVELLAAGLLQRERGPLGHETLRLTDAGIAVLAETLAKKRGLTNFSVLVSHVLVPPAMRAILSARGNRVQGFLGPGHVCTVVGCASP